MAKSCPKCARRPLYKRKSDNLVWCPRCGCLPNGGKNLDCAGKPIIEIEETHHDQHALALP